MVRQGDSRLLSDPEIEHPRAGCQISIIFSLLKYAKVDPLGAGENLHDFHPICLEKGVLEAFSTTTTKKEYK